MNIAFSTLACPAWSLEQDARRNGELTLLGRGDVPVRACVEALRRFGYAGWEHAR